MRCTIMTEGFGDMVFDLYPELAPITVKNFVETVQSGFYDGLAWCRIVKGYVIQGGSPDNDIMTDSDWHIKGEFEETGSRIRSDISAVPSPWRVMTGMIRPEHSFLWSIRMQKS